MPSEDIEMVRKLREEAYYVENTNPNLAAFLRDVANRIVELKSAKT